MTQVVHCFERQAGRQVEGEAAVDRGSVMFVPGLPHCKKQL
jgi:hypothetical protein